MTFGSVGCSMSRNPWACLSQPRWDSKPSTPALLNISSCFLTSNSRLSQSPSQLCLEGCTARGEGYVSSSQLVLLERTFSHGQSSFPGEHTALCAEETWDLWTPQSQPAPLECFWDSSNPRLVLNLLRCCCPQFSCPKSQMCPFCHSGGNCTLVLQCLGTPMTWALRLVQLGAHWNWGRLCEDLGYHTSILPQPEGQHVFATGEAQRKEFRCSSQGLGQAVGNVHAAVQRHGVVSSWVAGSTPGLAREFHYQSGCIAVLSRDMACRVEEKAVQDSSSFSVFIESGQCACYLSKKNLFSIMGWRHC